MKVLNLVTNAEAQFFEQQVATLEGRGIQIETLAVPGSRRTTDTESSSRSVFAYLKFYPMVLRRSIEEFDLVHANYGLTGPAALGQPRRPVVLTLWGSDLYGEYGWLSRWCARRADAVIVMTEAMAEDLGTVEAHVIPHGVDLDRFRPMDRSMAREQVGWRQDAKHVLFPYSKQRPVKDYPRAESVVNAVRDRIAEDVCLQTLYDVPHERMPHYMNAADALLLTSKHEGSPNSVKEAMACGLPVVATDVGDIRKRLSPVSPSHVCRTDEELIAGLLDVLEREERSDGRSYVESARLERVGQRIEAVYESLRDC